MAGQRISIPKRELRSFCRRNGVRRLMLFGSVLRDDFGPSSDVDVLVEFAPEAHVSLIDMARLERELTSLLGRQVDLRTPAELSRYFRDEVMAEAEVQYDAA